MKRFLGEFIEEVSERNKKLDNLPVLSVTNTKGFILSEDQFSKQVYSKDLSSYKIVYKNNLAYNPSRINVGSIALLEEWEKGLVSPLYVIFKVSEGMLPNYLLYYLQSKEGLFYIKNLGTGSVRDTVKLSTIKALKCYVPSIEKQGKIIKVLDEVKVLIKKRNEQISALDELTQSLFFEMFGDPNSKINKFPKKPLSDFGEIITGNTPSRKESEYYGDYIEWIKSDNINTPDHFLTTAEEYLSEKGLEKGRAVPENAILITCIAGSKNCIGNAAIANRPVAFNQQINAIVPKGNPYFLYTQFLVGKKLIQQSSTDGMKGLVSKGAFQKVEFIAPPLNLQDEFGGKFLTIQKQKQQLLESLAQLEVLYNSLLQKAFKGELFLD